MSSGDREDVRVRAVRELYRIARFDRMRGLDYWFDPDLGDPLRSLVREATRVKQGVERPRPIARPPAAPSPSPPSPPARPRPEAVREVPASTAAESPPGRPPEVPARTRPDPSSEPTARGGAALWNLPQPTPKPRRRSPSSSGSKPRPKPEWGPAPQATDREADWRELLQAEEEKAKSCEACELCRTRKQAVFGVGSAEVPLVFIGEAPGAEEDRQGIPFVGPAGQLLTKIIAAIGLSRDQVYICNILKCRPPGNRNPAPDEIQKCTPLLDRQLELLRPKAICTLGLFASQYLLDLKIPMGKLRGRVHEYNGIPVVPTYHPAALLRNRNPELKALVWDDVQLLRNKLDE